MLGLDPVINRVEKVVIQSRAAMNGGRSLRVDENTMIAFAMGQPEAVETVLAWRFAANRATRIITVSRERYEQIVNRNQVVFGGG
jgi:hypothetical protein